MSFEERFKNNINLVIEYINIFNQEPRRNEIYKGVNLSRFIYKLRCIYNKGYKNKSGSIIYDVYTLKKEDIVLLKKNNFDFNLKSDFEQFQYKVNLLNEYLKTNSWYSIKENTVYKNINIGLFVSNIRNIYKNGIKQEDGSILSYTYNKKRILSKDKVDYLDKSGFIWDKNKVEFDSTNEFINKKKYLLMIFNSLLNESKNNIKSKKDIDNLNTKYIKKLD